LTSVPFSSLEVYLSKDENPITIKHNSADGGLSDASIRAIELGDITDYWEKPIEVKTRLCWEPGSVLVLGGRIKSDVPAHIKVR
jgi:hypothetical protein